MSDIINDDIIDTDIIDTTAIEIPESLMETPDANMLNLEASDWEDAMITDLATKLNLSEDDIVTIMGNVLTNEVQAKYNNKPCMLKSIEAYFEAKYASSFDPDDWDDIK